MNSDEIPDDFNGVVRLFPLPNLVMFPGVVQGLHIFEPRYRQMTADALASDSLIAIVLLKPGWEEQYDGKPPIESVGCLGRITTSEQLADGRYNLRLRGLSRFSIVEELPTDHLYRMVRVELLTEVAPTSLDDLKKLRHELASAVLPRFEEDGPARQQIQELFDGELPLGKVCDILAYALPMPVELKQVMLAEPDSARRVAVITDTLRNSAARSAREFPPKFSPN